MDFELLSAVHAACFPSGPWSASEIEALATASTGYLTSVDEGFLLLRIAGPEAEVLTLAVAPHARRKGIARHLWGRAFQDLGTRGVEEVFLEVASGNVAARKLYESIGFQDVGRREAYYSNGEDALLLRCIFIDLSHRLA
jgi:ribosomal-protein-alanine N-acetyltransferase